ncbi:MAG: hypothetical protein L6Q97_19940, partial [Thermoanaerobaculia bacterium]|nr:hypothetical protein [Thermoanaerobaculia bacterium]
DPLLAPKQIVTGGGGITTDKADAGCVSVTDCKIVQPAASVTVAVYVPAARLLSVAPEPVNPPGPAQATW